MTIDITQTQARLLQNAVHAYLGEAGSQARELEQLLERLPEPPSTPSTAPPRFTAVESL